MTDCLTIQKSLDDIFMVRRSIFAVDVAELLENNVECSISDVDALEMCIDSLKGLFADTFKYAEMKLSLNNWMEELTLMLFIYTDKGGYTFNLPLNPNEKSKLWDCYVSYMKAHYKKGGIE